jgi:hypothetical protein
MPASGSTAPVDEVVVGARVWLKMEKEKSKVPKFMW